MNKLIIYCKDEKSYRQSLDLIELHSVKICKIYSKFNIDKNDGDDPKDLPGRAAFCFGSAALIVFSLFIYWAASADYPVNVGDKPLYNMSFIAPILFATSALFAAIGAVFAFGFATDFFEKVDENIKLKANFAAIEIPYNILSEQQIAAFRKAQYCEII